MSDDYNIFQDEVEDNLEDSYNQREKRTVTMISQEYKKDGEPKFPKISPKENDVFNAANEISEDDKNEETYEDYFDEKTDGVALEQSGPFPMPVKSDTPEKINTKIQELKDKKKKQLHEAEKSKEGINK